MSSMMIGALGAAFSVALMLGLWGEEAYRLGWFFLVGACGSGAAAG